MEADTMTMTATQAFVAALGLGLIAAAFSVRALDAGMDLILMIGVLLMALGGAGFMPWLNHRQGPTSR